MLTAPLFIGSSIRSRGRGAFSNRGGLFWATSGLLFLTLFTVLGLITTAARGFAVPEALYGCHRRRMWGSGGRPTSEVGLIRRVGAGAALVRVARGSGRQHRGRSTADPRRGLGGDEPPDRAAARVDPEAYYSWLTATNAAQAGNPLFPAGTLWARERGERTPSSGYCGTAGCHPRVHREWRDSPHATASTSPVYGRAVSHFTRERGEAAARWCRGCHGPAGLMAATGPAPSIDPGETRGVDCVACHAIGAVRTISRGTVEWRCSSRSATRLRSMRTPGCGGCTASCSACGRSLTGMPL